MVSAMNQLKRTLADGREISLVSFFVRNLAVGLAAGIAQPILDEDAVATAKRVWPEEPCVLLKPNPSLPAAIATQFLCMGEFVSYAPLPDSQDSASSLVVIWFQTALTPEFEQKALQDLVSIDWNKKAKSFSW